MHALLRLDHWLQTLPDPSALATDLSQIARLAAAFRLWDSVPENRRHDGRGPRTDRVAPIKINNGLFAIAEFMTFLLDNREEAQRVLGSAPWDHLDPAHPATWAPPHPVLNEGNYIDDHALAHITAYLPVLGAADETVRVTISGQQYELAGQGS
ncbi:hypothetical protein [Nonomuraea sp. NPDC003709]|uniref:hypothetical protein n=1 Tax=Nonomuraea sp. NPDC003709 TaxID=3154450 RepID=UPI0033A83AC9